MCGIFVDEVPQEFHRERKAVSEKLLEATEMALPIVQSITADDATADLDPEAVMQLLGSFQERVQQAIALEERIHPTVADLDPEAVMQLLGDSSDDGAPGSYNVEELDEALERQAAEDAQRSRRRRARASRCVATAERRDIGRRLCEA
eukprot:s6995_g10.t1